MVICKHYQSGTTNVADYKKQIVAADDATAARVHVFRDEEIQDNRPFKSIIDRQEKIKFWLAFESGPCVNRFLDRVSHRGALFSPGKRSAHRYKYPLV